MAAYTARLVARGLTAADAPALTNVLKSKALERVDDLFLYRNKMGDEGAAAIAAAAAAGGLPRLDRLFLVQQHIGAAGVQALASAFAGGAFRELDELTSAATRLATPASSLFPRPGEGRTAGAHEALALLQYDRWRGLKALMAALPAALMLSGSSIFGTAIGEEGIVALAAAIKMRHLPSVDVDVDAAANPTLVSACADRNIEIRIQG